MSGLDVPEKTKESSPADRSRAVVRPGGLGAELAAALRANAGSAASQVGMFVLFLGIGLAVGLLLSWSTGHSPTVVLADLLDGSFGNAMSISYTLSFAAPLLLVAAGTVICMQAGQFNIGQEGQVTLGAVGAGFVVFNISGPAIVVIPLAFAAAAVAGGLWAGLVALLKFTRGVNIVVSSLLFVFLAEQLMVWLISGSGPLHDDGEGVLGAGTASQSPTVPAGAELPTPHLFGLDVPSGFLIAAVAAIVVAWVLRSTLVGYRLRILGHSPVVAHTIGVSESRLGSLAVAASGAFAGAAGAVILLGQSYQLHPGTASSIGWNGLLIALAARTRIGVSAVLAIVFGAMIAGGGLLGSDNVPVDIVNVMTASIVVALLCPPVVLVALRRRRQRRAAQVSS
ncbi:ABC transporter permease [Dactylosporangium salmoneum]|uniref:ABC transporter permease n=1 Tax=Dactylosporangium salmoneum TaxID=53361 RepID=A0ABP5V9D6_9ACTN